MNEPDFDITIGNLVRAALYGPDAPGTCRDCGGSGVVPDLVGMREAEAHGCGGEVWRRCPTCLGQGLGGVA